MDDQEVLRLCDVIRQTGYDIHGYLKSGHVEKVYENALVHRLRKLGIEVKQQQQLTVYNEDGTLLGLLIVDLFVADSLLIELKACSTITQAHIPQIFSYLRAARIEHGLLINFGSPKFEIKKYVLRVAP